MPGTTLNMIYPHFNRFWDVKLVILFLWNSLLFTFNMVVLPYQILLMCCCSVFYITQAPDTLCSCWTGAGQFRSCSLLSLILGSISISGYYLSDAPSHCWFNEFLATLYLLYLCKTFCVFLNVCDLKWYFSSLDVSYDSFCTFHTPLYYFEKLSIKKNHN